MVPSLTLSDECEGVVQNGDVLFLFCVEFDIVIMFVHVRSNLWFLEGRFIHASPTAPIGINVYEDLFRIVLRLGQFILFNTHPLIFLEPCSIQRTKGDGK